MPTRLSNLLITKVYSVSTMHTLNSNNRIVRKRRPNWGLIIKYEGETVYKNQGKEYLSNANHLILLPKGAAYEWTCTQSGHYVVIEFESDLECQDLFSFKVTDSDTLLKTFKDLERLWLSKRPFFEMESINMIYSILLSSIKEHLKASNYTPNAKKNRLRPAISYIINNFTKPIKNEELAEICQISTIYFRKLFFEVYGTSPIKYIRNLRIRRAKEMLRSDYSSISDIAFSLGYNSIYEFSKDFKKHTGVPPSKY